MSRSRSNSKQNNNKLNQTVNYEKVLLYQSFAGATLLVAWTSADFEHVVRLPGVYTEGQCWRRTSMLGDQLGNVCHDHRGLHVNVSAAPVYLRRIEAESGAGDGGDGGRDGGSGDGGGGGDGGDGMSELPDQACTSASTRGLPFCNVSLPLETRVSDLVSRLQPDEKLAMMMTKQAKPPAVDGPRPIFEYICMTQNNSTILILNILLV